MSSLFFRLVTLILLEAITLSVVVAPASAQLSYILLEPKTLIDRVIEAWSSSDLARDNAIVIDVNRIMAKLGKIKPVTVIYDQKLLVTGLFFDAKTDKQFQAVVRNVKGVKKFFGTSPT